MLWGASWEERGKRPPFPCIFKYGQGGSKPLYLSRMGAEPTLEHTDSTVTNSREGRDSPTDTGTDLPKQHNKRGEEDYT